jgi:hypothetical protein
MPTSKVPRREGARYGGLDGSAGGLPAQLRALAPGYLFFSHYRYGPIFGVGATRHHGEAAKYHEGGHHEEAAHHARAARAHALHARHHSDEAAKSHMEEHGKK